MQQQLRGQSFSRATASAAVEIIEPIGTGKSGELITGSFYSFKEKSIVTLNSYGIQVNGKSNVSTTGNATIPTLQVFSSQQAYSITYSFDPLINNRRNEKETIRIESINIFPLNERKSEPFIKDQYSIGATLLMAPNQPPGLYTSGNPYLITVHFN